MEHIIQFAIGIDDDAIANRIKEHAEKNITNEIKQEVMKLMFEHNSWSGRLSDIPTEWTRKQVENFLYDHKDEIIQCAGNVLAEKLLRTKAVKEMVEGLKG